MFTILKKVPNDGRPSPSRILAVLHNQEEIGEFVETHFERNPFDILELRQQKPGDLEQMKEHRRHV